MPFALSVVAERVPVLVPPDLEKTTVWPPVVSPFPIESFVVSVRVRFDPEATVEEETNKMDWAKDTTPGETVIIGKELVTVLPPKVAPIVVADPEVTPVNIAE